MKDPFERTKVVVRHLPPGISQSVLMEQIDGRFAGRYKWVCFRSGRSSQKNQCHSRIYVDFYRPEDVVDFAEFFDGHVFVNEKGTQFKALVEYAPSQRVPKAWSKKDGREGTISKDPEYLEFLELLAKPVENLPSAEIQLEKKEAERAGGIKEAPIVTPLMQFVRQKRAAKSVSQRASSNVKLSRRGGGSISSSGSSSASSKRGIDKRTPSSMYVMRDSSKNMSRKDKATFILASRDQKHLLEKSSFVTTGNGKEALDNETGPSTIELVSGGSGTSDSGKKRVVLLKGKEREVSLAPGVALQNQSLSTSSSSSSFKRIPRHGPSGMIIRNVLTKEANNLEKVQVQMLDKDRRPPRPPSIRSLSKDRVSGTSDGDRRNIDDRLSGNDLLPVTSDKQDKRYRSKDRHDRGVWAPLRRTDGSHSGDYSVTSHNVQAAPEPLEHASIIRKSSGSGKVGEDEIGLQNSHPGFHESSPSHGEMKGDSSGFTKSGENRTGSGHGNFSITENGVHRHGGRRGMKEADGSGNLSEGKHSKRGMVAYGSHEKRKWVQKPASG